MDSYLDFVQLDIPNRLTSVWTVKAHINPIIILGQIKWFSPWRKYCFFSSGSIILDTKCMNEIIVFIKTEMDKRKN